MFVEDILDSMNQIEEYIRGMNFQDFSSDRKTIDAVIRNIEIIGEAAKNISEDIRKNYPEIPWKRVIGLRNSVIHAYFGIDLKSLWKIASVNIPEVKTHIIKILSSL
jgi:uncharacterized protein with HEPN domain